MKLTDKITTLKQLEELANAYFPCKVTVDPLTKGFGERGDNRRVVKLIVGYKKNPSYSPEAKVGAASKQKVADVRSIAIYSGMTVQEIVNEYLLKIKKSLEKKELIIDEGITTIQKPSTLMPTDNELADSLAAGKDTSALLNEQEEWQEEAGDWGDEGVVSENDKAFLKADRENVKSAEDSKDSIGILVQNIQTLAEDMAKLADKIEKIEKKSKK